MKTRSLSDELRFRLLRAADRHCARFDTSYAAIGRLAVNDHKFLKRLEAGENFNIATYERVENWLLDAEREPAA